MKEKIKFVAEILLWAIIVIVIALSLFAMVAGAWSIVSG